MKDRTLQLAYSHPPFRVLKKGPPILHKLNNTNEADIKGTIYIQYIKHLAFLEEQKTANLNPFTKYLL